MILSSLFGSSRVKTRHWITFTRVFVVVKVVVMVGDGSGGSEGVVEQTH